MTAPPVVLVVAKAPVPGTCKTRLAPALGEHGAAVLAARLLLHTVDVAVSAAHLIGAEPPVVALAGDVRDAVWPDQVRWALRRCRVLPQRGAGFADRLVAAHEDAAAQRTVVQIGTDVPDLTENHLLTAARALAHHPAALGPSLDGGWWLLGLQNGEHAAALRSVPMSTPRTGHATLAALAAHGLDVTLLDPLQDLDTPDDLHDLGPRLHDVLRVPDSRHGSTVQRSGSADPAGALAARHDAVRQQPGGQASADALADVDA